MGTNSRVRNNVRILGNTEGPVVMFAHGFGCDQGMFQRILDRFTPDYRVVLFDHVGAGNSDPEAYDPAKYSSLDGYTADVQDIMADLDLHDVTFVGHSVGGMMGVAAAAADPARFKTLVFLASSPSYMDYPEDGYDGGTSQEDIRELLASLDSNYMVWAAAMAPVIMGNPDSPQLHTELEGSFCRINPTVAREFAKVAFLSDVRHLLKDVSVPTLVMQCTDDLLAPVHVGEYTQQHLPNATLAVLKATGHLPHVSAPEETADTIISYLNRAA
ncbi:alpha/beta hydrolase [Arthrobacter sp. APC 3897]|uniref:alpha/beta fold hydrolase n=1 Tax=Arthrobacter sp. APC 3897 TaxID=3035204 RepID=UPI0025B45477|nr:alpha/beta hydrolase [Arthrobacter sp. APC 3897]MDN3480536.1 alpha/beta hydrolase [Arthrobacter sp. APC 3897]